MANALRNAVDRLLATVKRSAGETVTYRRGARVIEELTATPTAPQFQLVDENGQAISQAQYRDWIVAADELVLDDERITPAVDDVIEWTDANQVLHRFHVGALNGQEAWRWMDAQQQGLRIHSVLIGTE